MQMENNPKVLVVMVEIMVVIILMETKVPIVTKKVTHARKNKILVWNNGFYRSVPIDRASCFAFSAATIFGISLDWVLDSFCIGVEMPFMQKACNS